MGAGIVVDAEGLDTLAQLSFSYLSISLGLDFCLAFAIGSLGLLEDVDNVLALGAVSWCFLIVVVATLIGDSRYSRPSRTC